MRCLVPCTGVWIEASATIGSTVEKTTTTTATTATAVACNAVTNGACIGGVCGAGAVDDDNLFIDSILNCLSTAVIINQQRSNIIISKLGATTSAGSCAVDINDDVSHQTNYYLDDIHVE